MENLKPGLEMTTVVQVGDGAGMSYCRAVSRMEGYVHGDLQRDNVQ